jgi:hypothetical protein
MAGHKKKKAHKRRVDETLAANDQPSPSNGHAPTAPTLAGRLSTTLDAMVPVRFRSDVLAEVRRRAEADQRSVSSWIRLAVDEELRRAEH